MAYDYKGMWENLSSEEKRRIAKHVKIRTLSNFTYQEAETAIFMKEGDSGIWDFQWQLTKRSLKKPLV